MEKNSKKEWELMGTKLLLEQMKEERTRGDKVMEKWKLKSFCLEGEREMVNEQIVELQNKKTNSDSVMEDVQNDGNLISKQRIQYAKSKSDYKDETPIQFYTIMYMGEALSERARHRREYSFEASGHRDGGRQREREGDKGITLQREEEMERWSDRDAQEWGDEDRGREGGKETNKKWETETKGSARGVRANDGAK
ncbi:hypothetical protein RJT34_12558 [Clitoria ternatea]|uniref:Uncharacterized protein n=1 Tax=Clitoria ternatea TaxID=43366 RepID=A0AAN9PKL7_CLITE